MMSLSAGRNILILQRMSFSTSASRRAVLDGKKVADKILEKVKSDVDRLKDVGCIPRLIPIQVEGDPASNVYLTKKVETAKKVGIRCEIQRLPANSTYQDVMEVLLQLNKNTEVHGIIVQLPLPEGVNEQMICNAVDPHKDVDGFTAKNLGYLVQALEAKVTTNSFLPCTPLGVKYILEEAFEGKSMAGKKAVVLGRSLNVGLPIFLILHADPRKGGFGLTTTICHRDTVDNAPHLKEADVIVSAVGIPNLVRPEMVKPGAIIVDVGLNRIKDENTGKMRLCGDVAREVQDLEDVRVTPVPGGVGPCTVACLLHNTVLAAKRSMMKPSL